MKTINIIGTVNDQTMEAIAGYMNDTLREKVHSELAPCTNEEFLQRYIELHPHFADFIEDEFGIETESVTPAPFQRYELEAFIGSENLDDYDIDAIIDEVTEVIDGNRYWVEDVDLNAVCQRHDLSAVKECDIEELAANNTAKTVTLYDGMPFLDFLKAVEDLAASTHESPWHLIATGEGREDWDFACYISPRETGWDIEFRNPAGFTVMGAQAEHMNPFETLWDAVEYAAQFAARIYCNVPVVEVEGHHVGIVRNADGLYGFDNWGIPGSLYAGHRWFADEGAAREWLADYRANELAEARGFGEALKAGDPDGYHVRWTIPGSGNIDGDDFKTFEEAKACFDRMCLDSGRDTKLVDIYTMRDGEEMDLVLTNRRDFGIRPDGDEPVNQ